MKSKIFLILTIIVFIISCSNNTTKPNNHSGIKEKEELGNVKQPEDTTEEKPILPPLENYSAMYSGVAKYYIKTLDDVIATKPIDENIYVEIYDDSIVVYSGGTFFFDKIIKPSNKEYQSTAYYNNNTYKLYLKINADNTLYIRLSIRDNQYSYHFDADNLIESKQ